MIVPFSFFLFVAVPNRPDYPPVSLNSKHCWQFISSPRNVGHRTEKTDAIFHNESRGYGYVAALL